MSYAIEIYVDWNTQDNTGLPWTLLDRASDPSPIKPDAFVVAGHDDAVAVVEIVDVGDDGVVHVRQLPGPVSAHADRLRAAGLLTGARRLPSRPPRWSPRRRLLCLPAHLRLVGVELLQQPHEAREHRPGRLGVAELSAQQGACS